MSAYGPKQSSTPAQPDPDSVPLSTHERPLAWRVDQAQLSTQFGNLHLHPESEQGGTPIQCRVALGGSPMFSDLVYVGRFDSEIIHM